MSIYRNSKNSMKQADKEAILFQIEKSNYNETILQPGKIWCNECQTWTDEIVKHDSYLCCSACNDGLVMLI